LAFEHIWEGVLQENNWGVGRRVAGIWDIGEKVAREGVFGEKIVYGNLGVVEMAPFQGLGGHDPEGL
jgi:hypothetical protein